QVRQLIPEDLRGLGRGEVSLLVRPPVDGANHAADQLLDAALPLRCPNDPTEILGDDDIGSDLRPAGRDLHVVLFEDGLTLFVADGGLARFPLHLVERGHARAGTVPVPGTAVSVALPGA